MKLEVPNAARDVFYALAVANPGHGDDIRGIWNQGLDCMIALDSDSPPQFNSQGVVTVGQRWIVSLLSYEWAIAALEGQKEFVLDKDTMFELVARYRRQLSKAK